MLFLTMVFLQNPSFDQLEEEWRARREQRLKAEDGWLNLVGLHFLKPGANRFGSGTDMDLVLPPHSCVPFAGTFTLEGSTVHFEMRRAQRGLLNDTPAQKGTLAPQTEDRPADVLAHNHLRFTVIERGGRLALRVRDLRAALLSSFQPLSYFRAQEDAVVIAQFQPFAEPESMAIANILGFEEEQLIPGVLVFTWQGTQLELLPVPEGKQFFLMFKDKTSGRTTYGGGRYLYVDLPDENNQVRINFNRAYTPPCAFTAFATCPLPPARNWLPIALEAGEKYLAESHQGADPTAGRIAPVVEEEKQH